MKWLHAFKKKYDEQKIEDTKKVISLFLNA